MTDIFWIDAGQLGLLMAYAEKSDNTHFKSLTSQIHDEQFLSDKKVFDLMIERKEEVDKLWEFKQKMEKFLDEYKRKGFGK